MKGYACSSVSFASASKTSSKAVRWNSAATLSMSRVEGDLYPNDAGVIEKSCNVEIDFEDPTILNGFAIGASGALTFKVEAAIGADATASITKAFVTSIRGSSNPDIAGTVVFECVSSGDADPISWT